MNTLYLSVANYTAVRDLPDQVTIDGQTMSVLQALQYAGDMTVTANDLQAIEQGRGFRPVITVCISARGWGAIANIYFGLQNNQARQILGQLLGFAFFGNRPLSIVLQPCRLRSSTNIFTKGTAETVLISDMKSATAITANLLDSSGTVIQTVAGTTDASGNAYFSLTVPITYTEATVGVNVTQLLVSKGTNGNVQVRQDVVFDETAVMTVV